MENKIWLKPAEARNKDNMFKGSSFKAEKGDVKESLLECLYLDTDELDILKNNAVLFICSDPEGVYQKAVFGNGGIEPEEYSAEMAADNIDLSSFCESVPQKLKEIIGGKSLHIHLASLFELKSFILKQKDGNKLKFIEASGNFEDNGVIGELCAIELSGMESNLANVAEYADIIINETKNVRCPSPWVEAMRIAASGFQPYLKEKTIKKHFSSKQAQIFSVRLFELIKAYIKAGNKGFDKNSLHGLRVETRKLLTLIEALWETMGDKASEYIKLMESMLDDTDIIRNLDVMEEELDIIVSAFPRCDLADIQQLLTEKRAGLTEQLVSAYKSARYASIITSIWAGIHRRHVIWESAEEKGKEVEVALLNIKKWIEKMRTFKKSSMYYAGAVHDYRIAAKKARYTIESIADMLPKRLNKAASKFEKLQESFGAVYDIYQYLKILQEIAETSDKKTAYRCGIINGMLSMKLKESMKEAYDLRKEYRSVTEDFADMFKSDDEDKADDKCKADKGKVDENKPDEEKADIIIADNVKTAKVKAGIGKTIMGKADNNQTDKYKADENRTE